MALKNTLAYQDTATITAIQSLIEQTHSAINGYQPSGNSMDFCVLMSQPKFADFVRTCATKTAKLT